MFINVNNILVYKCQYTLLYQCQSISNVSVKTFFNKLSLQYLIAPFTLCYNPPTTITNTASRSCTPLYCCSCTRALHHIIILDYNKLDYHSYNLTKLINPNCIFQCMSLSIHRSCYFLFTDQGNEPLIYRSPCLLVGLWTMENVFLQIISHLFTLFFLYSVYYKRYPFIHSN